MHYPTLLSILLAATLATATPLTTSFEETPGTPALRANAATVKAAEQLANERLQKMEDVLNDPSKPENKEKIRTAFGPQAQIDKIKENVRRIKDGNMVIKSPRRGPGLAESVPHTANGGDVLVDGRPSYRHVKLGREFYADGKDDQAATLIHEAAHVLAGAEDDVYGPGKSPSDLRTAIAAGTPGIQIRNPNHGLGTTPTVWKEAGYAEVPIRNKPGQTRGALHADIVADKGASLSATEFGAVRDAVPNMHNNADSYAVFSSLCARSLYKRALSLDDPVGYYLAKRSQCQLPPGYLERKAAEKKAAAAAAAKGSAASSKAAGRTTKDVKGGPKAKGATAVRTSKGLKEAKGLKTAKAAKGTKGLKTTKATKGAKATKGLRAAKSAKGAKAAKGARGAKALKTSKTTRGSKVVKGSKAAKAGKGAKAVRKPLAKGAKSAKSAKGHKTVKAGKGAKGTKSSKGVKTAKSAKSGKGSKGAKGLKTAKATKGSKAVKGAKAAKASKGSKATRKAPAKGAKAKGGKATKSANGAKGGKSTKSVKEEKGGKGVKNTKGSKAKSSKARKNSKATKVAKGGKTAKESKATKGPKAAKGSKATKATKAAKDSKATKGVKAAKGAKTAKGTKSIKEKGVKATKARTQKSSAATRKVKTPRLSKAAGVRAPKAGFKAAAKPKILQRVAKVALKSLVSKKTGKKHRRDLESTLNRLD